MHPPGECHETQRDMQFDSSAHACLAEGETCLQQQPTASSTTRHAPRLFGYHYGGTEPTFQHFIYHVPHSFSALSQIIDVDAQEYPPPLITARVGQHASSNSCIATYTIKEGDLDVTYYKRSIGLTILFRTPASSHARKILGPTVPE